MPAESDLITFVGNEIKSLTRQIAEIDPYLPDEDMVEVLIGSFKAWGVLETQLLFPALEMLFEGEEGVETATSSARERLNALDTIVGTIHLGEGADGPFTELAVKYIDAIKYHLVADVQDILPLAAQLPPRIQTELAASMAAMKADLE